MMRLGKSYGESGQTLVWVALALVVLLAFVGLAIDGSLIWAQRRLMQNAADAGALAGAHQLCFGPRDPATEALDYAEKNGATRAMSSANASSDRVDVVAATQVQTSFVRLVGIDTVDVSAHAAARCGKATSACNLWPQAFDRRVWAATRACNVKYLLWGKSADSRTNCTSWSCTRDNQSPNGALTLEGRAWVDFTTATIGGAGDACDRVGCYDPETIDRMWGKTQSGQACRSIVGLNRCMVGDFNPWSAGSENDTWNPVVVRIAGQNIGQIRNMPLYASSGCALPPGTDRVCGPDTLLISDFACIRIEDTCKCTNPPIADGVIVVSVPCDAGGNPPAGCATECGIGSSAQAKPGDAKAVSLIE